MSGASFLLSPFFALCANPAMLPAALVVGRGEGSRAVPANPTKLLPSGSMCVRAHVHICLCIHPPQVCQNSP